MFATKVFAVLAVASAAFAAPVEKRTSGTATFYYQGGNAGSCGTVHSDSDYIVALPSSADPSSHCGDSVVISSGGKTITAKAADTCPSCDSTHIDLSVGAFTALGSESEGVLDITWYIQ